MKVVTVAQMREIDRIATRDYGILSETLMERAGEKVAAVTLDFIEQNRLERKVVIFAGKGNNGGDAYVAARYLKQQQMDVAVVVGALREAVSGEAALQLKKLEPWSGNLFFLPERKQVQALLYDYKLGVIVDGLLGTGLSGEVSVQLKDMISVINDSHIPVIAIDIPSGLSGDEGISLGETVRASVTVTMGLVKQGLIKNQGLEYSGRIVVAEIGFPKKLLEQPESDIAVITKDAVASLLKSRNYMTHKGDYGKILALAGSRGFTGAAYLACESALRAGAGLITLGIPKSLNVIMESKTIETISAPLPETKEGTLSYKSFRAIEALIKKSDVLLIGPGISTNTETKEVVRKIVKKAQIPIVLDADGINAFEGRAQELKKAQCPVVITPHEGEMARLLKVSAQEIKRHRLEAALQCARTYKVITVLKGAGTIVVSPSGEKYINLTGNPGMATAGAGDVLTGIIAGLLGNKQEPLPAALSGVYIHGTAGDLARDEKGEYGLIASDILYYVPYAIKSIRQKREKS